MVVHIISRHKSIQGGKRDSMFLQLSLKDGKSLSESPKLSLMTLVKIGSHALPKPSTGVDDRSGLGSISSRWGSFPLYNGVGVTDDQKERCIMKEGGKWILATHMALNKGKHKFH